jgi:carotenoid cleavage dioxygenase-like enzyme
VVLGTGSLDSGSGPALPMDGVLPPDLQGTLVRVGPSAGGAGSAPGALHAVELRDGQAVSYFRRDSEADAGVFWHAGSVLALPETGLPLRYDRFLEPREFAGGLTVPIASHVHRTGTDGGRVLFGVDDSEDEAAIWLRIGEWDASGALRTAQAVELERATWQHDIGVTSGHVLFVESPTARLAGDGVEAGGAAVPFGWVPGAEGWAGLVPRGGDGTGVRWFRVDPCLVTHVVGAWDEGEGGVVVAHVCRYPAPEPGQGFDVDTSVVGPAGIGQVPIGGGLAVLERWRLGAAGRLERVQVDDRYVEYLRVDPECAGGVYRYAYGVELGWGAVAPGGGPEVVPVGLLQFDVERDEVALWNPGAWCRPSEPLFVRATDGRGDDEGWLLSVVDDANRGGSDLYVLDASSFGRRRPEAVIHLPERLPFRSHGEWVPADRYR